MGFSFLFALNAKGYRFVAEELKSVLHTNVKVVLIPWALAPHDALPHSIEEYFPRFGRRYEREISYLREFGVLDKNVSILDDSDPHICDEIHSSDVVILCGGDPELLVNKLQKTKIDTVLQGYDGVIIGGSAGATSQFDDYFITPDQSFYNKLQVCKGIGLIQSDFLIDVHTNQYAIERSESENKAYLDLLKRIGDEFDRKIYGICDEGAIIYDRVTKVYRTYGKVILIK